MKQFIALVVAFVCAISLIGCSFKDMKRDLTLDELKLIAEKGDNISWSDFDPFIYSYEGGSGILFRTYPVGDNYVLHVQGWPDGIMSVILSTKVEVGDSADVHREIDIRTQSIDKFIKGTNE